MSSSSKRSGRGLRRVGAAAVALLVLDVLAAYQIHRSERPPSFAKGGRFENATANRPVPYSPAPEDPAFATTTTLALATTTVRGTLPPTTSGPTKATVLAPASTPALGTYHYAVAGVESASGFGQRRLPATLTLVAHRATGLAADEVVFDLTLSAQHEEREIVAYLADQVAFSFEGGSVTFGSATQTSQAGYDPVMPQVLLKGTSKSGTSEAKSAGGTTTRVEDWSVTRVGDETVLVNGAPVRTQVFDIQRRTRPGSADQLTRGRRYWFDPARHLWVKWHETMHGWRRVFGLKFSYDNDYTATLADFTPAAA